MVFAGGSLAVQGLQKKFTECHLVSLLTEIENLHVCGATNDQFNEGGCVIYHVLRKENAIPVDEDNEITLNPYACDVFYRSRNCIALIEGGNISCQECISDDKKSTYKINLKSKNVSEPASKYAPVTKTNPNRLRLTIQEQRYRCFDWLK